MFSLHKVNDIIYTVYFKKSIIGEIYKGADGFFVFAFASTTVTGCFPERFFRFISEHLQALNEDWSKQCESS